MAKNNTMNLLLIGAVGAALGYVAYRQFVVGSFYAPSFTGRTNANVMRAQARRAPVNNYRASTYSGTYNRESLNDHTFMGYDPSMGYAVRMNLA